MSCKIVGWRGICNRRICEICHVSYWDDLVVFNESPIEYIRYGRYINAPAFNKYYYY